MSTTFLTTEDVSKLYESSGNLESSSSTVYANPTDASPNTTTFPLDSTSFQEPDGTTNVSTLIFSSIGHASTNILKSSAEPQTSPSPTTDLQTTPYAHTYSNYPFSLPHDLLTTGAVTENIREMSIEPTSAQSFSPRMTLTSIEITSDFTSTTLHSTPATFFGFSPLQFGLLIGGSGLALIIIFSLIVLFIISRSRRNSLKKSKAQSDGWITNPNSNLVVLSAIQHRQSLNNVDEDVKDRTSVNDIEAQTINVFENMTNSETGRKTETMRRSLVKDSDIDSGMANEKRATIKRELTPVRIPTLSMSSKSSLTGAESTTDEHSGEEEIV